MVRSASPSGASFVPEVCIRKLMGTEALLRMTSGDRVELPRLDDIEQDNVFVTDPEQFAHPTALSKAEVLQIVYRAREILSNEKTLVEVSSPVTVIGDIHGQLFDLYELMTITGRPPEAHLLFLGDYVDRGHYSLEVILLILCFKIRWMHRVTMLRGNHETWQITQVYGFYDEVVRKYGDPYLWTEIQLTFNCLPICATIDQKIFLDHGGLTPDVLTIDSVRDKDRFRDISTSDILSGFLWSDPETCLGFQPSNRGAGYHWGADVSKEFTETNGLRYICRAHQLQQNGYRTDHDNLVLTIFSAPNYCYRCNNQGGIVEVPEYGASLPPIIIKFSPAPNRNVRARQPDKARLKGYFDDSDEEA